MSLNSETKLVEAARNGHLESFGALYERYHSPMVALAYSMLADRDLAEDAAQEVFAVACRDIGSLKSKEKFAAWLAGICRNTARQMLRSKGREIAPNIRNFAKNQDTKGQRLDAHQASGFHAIQEHEQGFDQTTERTNDGVELVIVNEDELSSFIPDAPGEIYEDDNGTKVSDIALVMGPASVISGKVVDIAGQPVTGAVVQIATLKMQLGTNTLTVSEFDEEWRSSAFSVTDNQGCYTIANLPNCWCEVRLKVYATGLATTSQFVTKAGEDTIWDIQLDEDDRDDDDGTNDESEHFRDVIADGYPLRGGSNVITETVPSNLKNNLILYYSFYSIDNAGTAADISGNNYHGQVHGANYTQDDILGGMMSFNGDDNYISTPILHLKAFTFSAWLKTTTDDLNNRRIFLLDDSENYYSIQGNSGGGIGVYITEDLEITEYDRQLDEDKWTYVTVTFDNHTVNIYSNGRLTESGTSIFSEGVAGNAYIGFSGYTGNDERHDGDHCWQGMIDEVALFNRALTAEEVQQLYLMTGTYIE